MRLLRSICHYHKLRVINFIKKCIRKWMHFFIKNGKSIKIQRAKFHIIGMDFMADNGCADDPAQQIE